jgi:hypothetical protein
VLENLKAILAHAGLTLSLICRSPFAQIGCP